MTRNQARELVDRMLAIWPNPRCSAATIDEYESVLADVGSAVAGIAVERLRDTRATRPSIAHLVETIAWVEAEKARPVRRSAPAVRMLSRAAVHDLVARTKEQAREAGARAANLRVAS